MKPAMMRIRHIFLATVLVVLTGCAGAPINPKLNSVDPGAGYRYQTLPHHAGSEDLFVILAFSGGGTRAAAFSFGLLEALNDIELTRDGRTRRLLEEINVISSISGGSFTSMYYGLFPETIFEEYPEAFLYRNVQRDLALRAMQPSNLLRMLRPDYSRIDMAADYYGREIFKNKTYGDLMSVPGESRPYILVNATDMTLNSRFEFTQDQFDLLCSDLAGVPVSRAVAASSAFPVFLNPITFKNHAADKNACNYPIPPWLKNAMKTGNGDFPNPPRRYFEALNLYSYQDDPAPWVHLLDGGLADNIGLRGPINALTTLDSPWSVLQLINQEKVKRVMVITANAKTRNTVNWNTTRTPPNTIDVLGLVMTGPMDNYSFDTVEKVSESFKGMEKDARAQRSCQNLVEKKVVPACKKLLPDGTDADLTPLLEAASPYDFTEIPFDAIELAFQWMPEKDYPGLKQCLEGLPTSFSLTRDAVDLLRQSARYLLMHSDDFVTAVKKLDENWQPPVPVIDLDLIKRVCDPKTDEGN